MEALFKKLLEKKVCDTQGIAYCLAELAKNSDFKSVMDICVNGIPSWSVNPDIVRKYIYNEYHRTNIIIDDIQMQYAQGIMNVIYSFNSTRWYKSPEANQYDSARDQKEGEYIHKLTFVRHSSYAISYENYLSAAEGLSKLKIDDETPVEG